jgi:signal transduction histidine kinase
VTTNQSAPRIPFTHRTIVKVLAVVLCSFFILTSLFSIISVVLLAEFGFYTGTFDQTQEEIYLHFGKDQAEQTLYNSYYSVMDSDQLSPEKMREYDARLTHSLLEYYGQKNVLVTFLDHEGQVIISTYSGEEIQFEGQSTWLFYDGVGESAERTVQFFIPVEKESAGIFYILDVWLSQVYDHRFSLIAVGILSCVMAVSLFVLLLCAAGHHPAHARPRLNTFDRLPTDLMLALYGGYAYLLSLLATRITTYWEAAWIVPGLLIILISAPLLVLFFMSFSTRCKCGTLIKNTLCYYVLVTIWRGLRWLWLHALCPLGCTVHRIVAGIPLVWKTAVLLISLAIIEFLTLMLIQNRTLLIILWAVETVLITCSVLFLAQAWHRLQEGSRSLAEGNLHHKVDTSRLPADFKRHAEDLNSIREGISRAVEERMKSEHFRTELITNVSHDIKTPLTTIISYVNLLAGEPYTGEAAKKYLATLERQSTRLKKLMEDLLEVSKATTGNLTVHPAPCELEVMLSQALGEYEERMQAAQLIPVLHIASPSPIIMADGRLLWRVFDNLLSNAVKYAMPGTRVYLDLKVENSLATLMVRNISKTELNVPAEELLERFVRGDRSRHTEGSGLGLSIARSLTELMGGELSLEIDGDLFKVMVKFPIYTSQ